MTWLTWRQFRVQAVSAVVVLAALAIAYALTGPQLARRFERSGLDGCVDHCGAAQAAFAGAVQASGWPAMLYAAGVVVLYLAPAVIGMFWGAPLVARELEAGTLRLAWTQSVTRTRWVAAKVGLVGAGAVLGTGLLSLAVTWWSAPVDRAAGLPAADEGLGLPNRFAPLIFGARDVVPVGHAVFAFALGVAVGLLARRTVPAMAVTLAVLGAVQVLVPLMVRPHYQTPARVTTPLVVSHDAPHVIIVNDDTTTVSVPYSIPGAWITDVQAVDAAGRPFTGPAPEACTARSTSPEACDDAVNQLRLRQLVTYQPADRFWRFQWYETTLYLLLALASGALALWQVRRVRLQ